jgi:hypothetical protein
VDHPFLFDILCAVEAVPDATILAQFGTLLIHTALPGDDIEDPLHNDTLHGLAQDADLSDDTNVPPTGDRICELENAVTSLGWTPEQHAFSNVAVDNDAGMLNKSCALSLLFKYSKSTSSADQLHRVQQQAQFMESEPETLTNDSYEELGDILMVNNPIASLILWPSVCIYSQ